MKYRLGLILVACGLIAAAFGLKLRADDAAKPPKSPDTFKAKFETTCGTFVVEVKREWSPNGADRFYQLVHDGLYDNCKFFRVVPGFVVQFGINGDPKVAAKWQSAKIADDAVKQSNARGFVTFAMAGRNTRTTQIFINYKDNKGLDTQGFSPFGKVIEGMDAVDKIYAEYADSPDQGRLQDEGNAYLNAKFPKLDGIKKATIVE